MNSTASQAIQWVRDSSWTAMNEATLNVFVYGTLQPGGRYHRAFFSGYQPTASEAWVHGRLFDFPKLGYPAAAEDPDGKVYGYLISIEQADERLLQALDQLEGYDPNGPPADNLYYRVAVCVHSSGEQTAPVTAWCYFMPLERISEYRGVELPDGRWVQCATG